MTREETLELAELFETIAECNLLSSNVEITKEEANVIALALREVCS